MARYEIVLEGHEEVAQATLAFRFEKPAGFSYRAGQAGNFALIDPPADPNSARRVFSLASAPYEDDLVVATRMREGSAFKRALGALPPGARLKLVGPVGTMTLHEDSTRAAVFIAGGIGITPFRSIVNQALHEGSVHRLYLLYSNRRREHAAFLSELEALARAHERFRLRAVMTDTEGMVGAQTLASFTADAAAPVYYVAGPPAMVAAMKTMLAAAGADDVISEEFFGY
ncbi:MAG TPA: FAD-dependent oxidoreductase [Burkholderiaceae bacterium]|nr:FAD-dependent oxidoreductase [Burkholderiaceae bacterium]